MERIYEDSTVTARKIRARLKKEYPKLPKNHFKVTTSRYSGGSSINVSWEDFPMYAEVDKIVNEYKSASFDGMVDLETRHGYIDPEDGLLYSGAGYVFANYRMSTERRNKIIEVINDTYEEGYDENNYSQTQSQMDTVNKMLDMNNELKDEYKKFEESPEDRDFEKDKEEFIEFYMDNFPFQMYTLDLGADLLGEIRKEGQNQIITIGENLGFRVFFKSCLEKDLTIKVMEKEFKASKNHDDYRKNVYYVLNNIYRTKISSRLNRTMIQFLKTTYMKLVESEYNNYKGNPSDSAEFKNEVWKKTGLVNKGFLDSEDFFFDFLQVRNYTGNSKKLMSHYVQDTVEELYLTFGKNKTNYTDAEVIQEISKHYYTAPQEFQARVARILSKNHEVLKKYILNNDNLLSKEHLVLKYSTMHGVTNVSFFQTPYGLWILETPKYGGSAELKPIYRLGVDSIKECVRQATRSAHFYNLPKSVIEVAQSMYLR